MGAYRDDNAKPVVLDCVREAERRIAGKNFMEYLPTNGNKEFVQHSIKLAYGEDRRMSPRAPSPIQTLSGTGSCRLMADFMHRFAPGAKVYIPTPTWSNHHNIWKDAGCEERTFRYYKAETRGLDFEGMMEDINNAEPGSFFLLHACAHNPTGVDPSPEQWRAMSAAMKERNLFPFFDMAYQGFASGDCERDAQASRIFVEDGHKVGCSQSFAKNMGLYGQRIGCFSIMCDDADEAARVESQMKLLARPMYSNPPFTAPPSSRRSSATRSSRSSGTGRSRRWRIASSTCARGFAPSSRLAGPRSHGTTSLIRSECSVSAV